MPKFKVGDKVKYIGNDPEADFSDSILTVGGVRDDWVNCYLHGALVANVQEDFLAKVED